MTLLERIEAHVADERHRNHAETVYWLNQYKIWAKEAAERIKTTNDAIKEVRIIGNNKTLDDARKLFCISSVLGHLQALNGDKE